jgi:putative transposase
MSFVRIWVHAVFSTKNREPYFTSEIRKQLIAHIKENCKLKGIHLDSIGGWSEHLHILIALGPEQNIAKLMMLIKGESAHWLNGQGFFKGKFIWQDDYFAVSVSESRLEEVRHYIRNQEAHHRAVPFSRELESFTKVVNGSFRAKAR